MVGTKAHEKKNFTQYATNLQSLLTYVITADHNHNINQAQPHTSHTTPEDIS